MFGFGFGSRLSHHCHHNSSGGPYQLRPSRESGTDSILTDLSSCKSFVCVFTRGYQRFSHVEIILMSARYQHNSRGQKVLYLTGSGVSQAVMSSALAHHKHAGTSEDKLWQHTRRELALFPGVQRSTCVLILTVHFTRCDDQLQVVVFSGEKNT